MRLLCLGTGTLVPEGDRASSGLAVVEGDRALPMDLGRNVLNRMVESGLEPLSMGELLLTHVHPDHCCDLVSLLFARNYATDPDARPPLRITGPEGVGELVERLGDAWRWLRPRFELRVEEVDGGWSGEREGFEVEAVSMQHGETAALGYRVGRGRRVAFTGDTGPGPGLRSLASDCDLLVAECGAAGEIQSEVHLTVESLREAVVEAACPRLLVTHLPPGTDREALRERLSGDGGVEVLLAEDGLAVEV